MLFNYLLICPLVFIAGYVDAIAGGGGLISLPAYMMTGLPVHNCIATNKMSSSMGTSVACWKYAKSGFIPWKSALFCIPCAFLGSSTGANIALHISDGPFRVIMLIVLPLTGAYILNKKDLKPSGKEYSSGITIAISMLSSFLIGIYDGFYGPGTGTFLLLILTGLARLPVFKANGLTKIINLSRNVSALAVFLLNAQVLFPLGVIAGAFNIAGNYLGARHFEKSGSKAVKPVIITVLVIFFIKVLSELIAAYI